MKRKIKFRGKDDAESWQYGLPTYIGSVNSWMHVWDRRDELNDIRVKNDTLGQFTGMVDRNGVEIYEGDILRFEGKYTTSLRKVEWITGGFNLVGITDVVVTEMPAEMRWEVVGNVFDNPELLENEIA